MKSLTVFAGFLQRETFKLESSIIIIIVVKIKNYMHLIHFKFNKMIHEIGIILIMIFIVTAG